MRTKLLPYCYYNVLPHCNTGIYHLRVRMVINYEYYSSIYAVLYAVPMWMRIKRDSVIDLYAARAHAIYIILYRFILLHYYNNMIPRIVVVVAVPA